MTYIIAEIGQNHCGELRTAMELVEMAAQSVRDPFSGEVLAPVDAVKFTVRDLDAEMVPTEWQKPYESEHSYGATYAQHRKALELSSQELHQMASYARSLSLDFGVTICGPAKVDEIVAATHPNFIKVASRDLTNGPLLEKIAGAGVRIILSTGMDGLREIRWAVSEIELRGGSVDAVLHCLSSYPAFYSNVGLRSIPMLKAAFPDLRVGYSDHTIGVAMGPVAVALGAEIVEKHITLDRGAKGTDHAGSLEPTGLWRFVRDIRNTEAAMSEDPATTAHPAALPARDKLRRSCCAAAHIPEGVILGESDIVMLSPGTGVPWTERHRLIGHRTIAAIEKHALIDTRDVGIDSN